MSYERVRVWDTNPGDVVRRRGHPLRVGIVVALEDDQVLVRWAARDLPQDTTWHRFDTLERRGVVG